MAAVADKLQAQKRPIPRACIETGTYQGAGTKAIARILRQIHGFGSYQVHTIELSPHWYEYSRRQLADLACVWSHHGDSAVVLRDLLTKIRQPCWFYLDAHFAGGDTAGAGPGEVHTPVLLELEAIAARTQPDVIIIDDVRLFGSEGQCGVFDSSTYPMMQYDWRHVTTNAIRDRLDPSDACWVQDDRLIVVRNPQGAIYDAAETE
jgi:hypothetical protein